MIDLPEAKDRLEPLVPILVAAHEAAMTNWVEEVKKSPGFTLPLDTTTRANVLHNHVCAQVTLGVANVTGVEPNDRLGFYALMCDPDILLRFKYVGHGAPANIATQQQALLAKQTYSYQMMLSLTGDASLDPPTLLTCGYVIDGDTIGRIEIRRECKGHQTWSYDIYGGDAVIMPQALPGQEDHAKPARIKRIAAEGEDAASANGAS
jgi:hypothetical protein